MIDYRVAVNSDDRARYLAALKASSPLGFFRSRSFRAAEEWDKLSQYDWRDYTLGRYEAGFDSILQHPWLVVLGHPGAGKSMVARAAIDEAVSRGWLPVLVDLKGYSGNLTRLLESTGLPPDELTLALAGVGDPILLILDGLDELGTGLLSQLTEELKEVKQSAGLQIRVLLTARQAFFATHKDPFLASLPAFALLGLDEEDVRAIVRHDGVDPDAFLREAEAAQLSQELRNPFALGSLLKAYKRTGKVGPTRSAALDAIIDDLLHLRPNTRGLPHRRALCMLAVAMEAAARNELTEDEALKVRFFRL